MFIIPGFIIAILTFPGVIIHELAHQLFCYICGLKVYEVKYFQFKNPSGYVIHEASKNPAKTMLISMGPFIVNTLLGILILTPVTIELFVFNDLGNPLYFVVLWLGISVLMHAFPSRQDGKVMVEQILNNSDVNIFIKILVAPIILLVYIGAFGSMLWLDLVYAIGIAILIPQILPAFM